MKRPQYVFRPNLNEPQHRRAWALLQQVPPAKRKEFLVQSILAAEQTDRLEKSIRKVVREELQAVNMNVRRARCRQVGAYLHWLYDHKYTDLDYSLQLPNFKRTAPQIPQVWSPEEIDKILAVIDTANPVGRRNYAIFLLLARTGLRISDVLGLKFSNINWKENCISLSQQKTGNALSLPLSKELGMAIISYLQDGRPQSSSAFIFLSHNAPFQPLGEHNNFNPEFHKYLRRAGIAIPTKRHTGVHTIRHSFATNMLRKGTPVQDVSQILGHSNISVTETYLRVDIEHMRLCSLSLEGLL